MMTRFIPTLLLTLICQAGEPGPALGLDGFLDQHPANQTRALDPFFSALRGPDLDQVLDPYASARTDWKTRRAESELRRNYYQNESRLLGLRYRLWRWDERNGPQALDGDRPQPPGEAFYLELSFNRAGYLYLLQQRTEGGLFRLDPPQGSWLYGHEALLLTGSGATSAWGEAEPLLYLVFSVEPLAFLAQDSWDPFESLFVQDWLCQQEQELRDRFCEADRPARPGHCYLLSQARVLVHSLPIQF